MDKEHRVILEVLGEEKVKLALAQGMLVSELVPSAHEWLREREKQEKPDAS